MNNPILQFSILLFLLFATHIYFLLNKILTKKEKASINNLELSLIILALGMTTIIFGILCYDFIANQSSMNPLDFILKYKDIIIILITAVTAFFIYRQVKTAQETTQKQIKAAQDSLNIQIEHQNKMKDIETIKNSINNIVQRLETFIETPAPAPDSYIHFLLRTRYDNHDFEQDFSLKIITFTNRNDGNITTIPWDVLSNYFQILKNNSAGELRAFIRNSSDYEYRIMRTHLINILYACEKLFNLGSDSLLFIHSVLLRFHNISKQLKYYKFDDDSFNYNNFIMSYNTYLALYKNDVIPSDDIRKLFLNEINNSTLLDNEIKEHNIEDIRYNSLQNAEESEFTVRIDGEVYERCKGIWSKVVS